MKGYVWYIISGGIERGKKVLLYKLFYKEHSTGAYYLFIIFQHNVSLSYTLEWYQSHLDPILINFVGSHQLLGFPLVPHSICHSLTRKVFLPEWPPHDEEGNQLSISLLNSKFLPMISFPFLLNSPLARVIRILRRIFRQFSNQPL